MGTVKNILIFSIGISIGVIATQQYFKRKYMQIAQDEIDSVKEVFSKRGISKEDTDDETLTKEELDILNERERIANKQTHEYVSTIQELGYKDIEDEPKEVKKMNRPYVITPDEFGDREDEGYDTVSLVYYSDGILTDDVDQLVEDVDDTIGLESLNHFGEYEDDSVFVRDERKKVDYEILKDNGVFYGEK